MNLRFLARRKYVLVLLIAAQIKSVPVWANPCQIAQRCVEEAMVAQAMCNPSKVNMNNALTRGHELIKSMNGVYTNFECELPSSGKAHKALAVHFGADKIATESAGARVDAAADVVEKQCEYGTASGKKLAESQANIATFCTERGTIAANECAKVKQNLPTDCSAANMRQGGDGCGKWLPAAKANVDVLVQHTKLSTEFSVSQRVQNFASYFNLTGEANKCFLAAANPNLLDREFTLSGGQALLGGAGVASAGALAGSLLSQDDSKARKAQARANEEAAKRAEVESKNQQLLDDLNKANEQRNKALQTVTPGSGIQLPDASAFKAYFTFNGDLLKQQSFILALERIKAQIGTGTMNDDIQSMFRQQSSDTQKNIRDAVGVADGASMEPAKIIEGMQKITMADSAQAAVIMERVGQAARLGSDANARSQICGTSNSQPIDCVTPNQRLSNSIFVNYDTGYLDITNRSPADRQTCITAPDGSGQTTCSTAS